MKIEYEFFSFERFGRMHENKNMFFFNVLTKTGYFNTECCIFSNIKILLDINQNDIKNTRENCKIPKNIFEFFF